MYSMYILYARVKNNLPSREELFLILHQPSISDSKQTSSIFLRIAEKNSPQKKAKSLESQKNWEIYADYTPALNEQSPSFLHLPVINWTQPLPSFNKNAQLNASWAD